MDIATASSMVLETLRQATNQNPDILKPAQQKLRDWEIEPGFYSLLLNIFSNHSIDNQVRCLAILCFKNGIDRYWRKSAPNAISENEKAELRRGLLMNIPEPINQNATHLAAVMAKIARFDFPREWPDLMENLIQGIQSGQQLIEHRSFLILHHIIKGLSSKCLVGDRRAFQELSITLFPFVNQLWNAYYEEILIKSNSTINELSTVMEKGLLSLRVLRKLVAQGLKKPHEYADCVRFFDLIFDRCKTMLELRKNFLGKNTQLVEITSKLVIDMTKVLLNFHEQHPLAYVNWLERTLNFSSYYAFAPEAESLLFEKFVVQCFNMIKAILMCTEYKPSKNKDINISETKDICALQAYQIKVLFFQNNTLTEMCRKIVSHYFLLTKEDLELWDSDPEEFATDEGGESWKYNLGPCTEKLFLALFREFRLSLVPVLLDMIRSNETLVDPSDLGAILQKDAVYKAVGLAAFELYDEVNFDHWFSTTLTQELSVKANNYRVLRRRIALLLGRWTSVKFSADLRPALYTVTLPLLRTDEDMAVRLAASRALKSAIDDFEFHTEQFLPFLEPAFRLLFALLKEARECDTKMHVLSVLSFMIERVGYAVRPHSSALVQFLPLLWEESTDHNMLRCAIVSMLVHLVKALGSVSTDLSMFVLPIIRVSTDVNQPSHIYLLEDGLELWLAVLENTPSITPPLSQLAVNIFPLLEGSSETLPTCYYIIQAYVLLSPVDFLKTYGEKIMLTCGEILSDLRDEGIAATMRLVELCVRASPQITVLVAKPVLPRVFHCIHKATDYPMLMSIYLSIVARIILFSFNSFSELICETAQLISQPQEQVLERIMDIWLDKLNLVSQPERRKLLGLALASLLPARLSIITARFSKIIAGITEILNDVTRVDETGVHIDTLMTPVNDSPSRDGDTDYETEHDLRRKQLSSLDPVHMLQLKEYFQSQLHQLSQQVGTSNFEQMVQILDPDILSQFREYVAL